MSFDISESKNNLEDKFKVANHLNIFLRRNSVPIIMISSRYLKYGLRTSNARYIINCAIEAIELDFSRRGIKISSFKIYEGQSYYIALMSTDCMYPTVLKKIAMNIEHRSRIGSLMDIDVIDIDATSLTRRICEIEPRKCIICDDYATECLRHLSHKEIEYEDAINEIISNDKFGNKISA
ncbi:citrate lyase holo-[acyl-carrier protein] synthase [Vibrio diazotrophicus]|uniref:citrate lyase holo-[acyl-carrier protein] synthase n=1 Tax=Vibrio diazotrophicus TaxID=685 RepID=A0ABX4W7U9_VIBDI|nr:citrate lyase holo-[acyl-carrier protein] synthase [Vibrio diazotrophicus]PNH95588.1 hypothetical protein C1O24_13890 [Vibrio diazotrophicus]PNH99852.1 hypothetical protein C1O25_14605 [Vibrio diazotrophicus]